MKAKQTAVEWLFKNLLDTPISNEDIIYNISVFEEAKEMERRQIINAVYDAQRTDFYVHYYEAEEYYNEKYNTK
jgi:ABC-type Zn2+ transport system substrate-binding protein/surface adhesin